MIKVKTPLSAQLLQEKYTHSGQSFQSQQATTSPSSGIFHEPPLILSYQISSTSLFFLPRKWKDVFRANYSLLIKSLCMAWGDLSMPFWVTGAWATNAPPPPPKKKKTTHTDTHSHTNIHPALKQQPFGVFLPESNKMRLNRKIKKHKKKKAGNQVVSGVSITSEIPDFLTLCSWNKIEQLYSGVQSVQEGAIKYKLYHITLYLPTEPFGYNCTPVCYIASPVFL